MGRHEEVGNFLSGAPADGGRRRAGQEVFTYTRRLTYVPFTATLGPVQLLEHV